MQEEAAAIAAAAARLSSEEVEGALGLLERCADRKAKLVITGVGKSGIVARKIAATFSSMAATRPARERAGATLGLRRAKTEKIIHRFSRQSF